jgi:hypothetical protein
MEAVRTSEPSVYSSETTRRYILKGSSLHTRRRENLKSHRDYIISLNVINQSMFVMETHVLQSAKDLSLFSAKD